MVNKDLQKKTVAVANILRHTRIDVNMIDVNVNVALRFF